MIVVLGFYKTVFLLDPISHTSLELLQRFLLSIKVTRILFLYWNFVLCWRLARLFPKKRPTLVLFAHNFVVYDSVRNRPISEFFATFQHAEIANYCGVLSSENVTPSFKSMSLFGM